MQGIIFDEDLVLLDLQATDREGLLGAMATKLMERGYVNGDFINAILKREQEFPTGIAAKDMGVAFPHADPGYVKETSIAVGVLAEPVTFKQMVSEEDVPVNVVFMLAIKEPEQQVTMLQRLMGIIQEEGCLNAIFHASSQVEVADLIKESLGDQVRNGKETKID